MWAGASASCIASATSCNAVYACMNLGKPSGPCDAGVPGLGCNGTVLGECNQGHAAATDCSANGDVCTSVDSLDAFCTLGACTTAGMTCGGAKVLCCGQYSPGMLFLGVETDCSTLTGATCNPAGLGDAGGCFSGDAVCIGGGPSCNGDACNGTTLAASVCVQGNRQRSIATRAFALGCAIDDAGVGHCARGLECNEGFQDTCTGSVLTFCDDGKRIYDRIDLRRARVAQGCAHPRHASAIDLQW